jgi:hypothetical protein
VLTGVTTDDPPRNRIDSLAAALRRRRNLVELDGSLMFRLPDPATPRQKAQNQQRDIGISPFVSEKSHSWKLSTVSA